ncbi:hypothetical protein [Dyella silvae]|uniref:hypothetical protein n=1 Tax=Dyella silvae TaxID=2994424 RepID=UPI002264C5C4|nr:hypothetical protein [Dyella silvae]
MPFFPRTAKKWVIDLALVTLASLPVATVHASGADATAYLAVRDKAVAEFKAVTDVNPAIEHRHSDVLHQLQGMLKAIVEPIRLEGYASSGTYNIETLFPELGYGKLDAMVVNALNGKSKAYVSTVPLMVAWLGSDPDVLKHPARSPANDLAEAFASEDFYTFAISNDAHYYLYAELPVTPVVASGRAHASLYAAGQDVTAPYPPSGLVVAVMSGERVVIFDEPVSVPDVPDCAAAYQKDMSKAEAVWAAYRASRSSDKATVDKAEGLEDTAARHFYQCYAQHLPGTPVYAALVGEAQALVDKVR